MKQTQMTLLVLTLILTTTMGALTHSPAQSPAAEKTPLPAQAPAETPSRSAEAPSEIPVVEAPPRKAKPAPPDVAKILEKAGGFGLFARILRSTQVASQMEVLLNTTSNTLTVLAPTDAAFSGLKPGTLNSLTAEQKVMLAQYHLLPSLVSLPNFQTLTNPVRTNAGDYLLNVTTGGGNSVNFSTGMVNASVSGTVYADDRLAVYKLDKVLLPVEIFAPERRKKLAPAPAPAVTTKGKPKKDKDVSGSSDSSDSEESEESVGGDGGGGHAAALGASGGVRMVRDCIGFVVATVGVVVFLLG